LTTFCFFADGFALFVKLTATLADWRSAKRMTKKRKKKKKTIFKAWRLGCGGCFGGV
jgi:hypothetical protein